MSVIKTLKHEMEYDSETKRAIFNGRNKTRLAPTQNPFPERLLASASEPVIEDDTLVVGPSDEIEDSVLTLSVGSIEEHTLVLN